MSYIRRTPMDGFWAIRSSLSQSLTIGESHGAIQRDLTLTICFCTGSGDLGDFASFVTHMQELAVEKDVDLLLVDSGDVHDGTGLSDGFPSGGIDGHAVRSVCPSH